MNASPPPPPASSPPKPLGLGWMPLSNGGDDTAMKSEKRVESLEFYYGRPPTLAPVVNAGHGQSESISKKCPLDLPSPSPRDSLHSTDTVDGPANAVDSDDSDGGEIQVHESRPNANRAKLRGGAATNAVDFDSFELVTKSIFKEKKGFLTRLKDVSSSVKHKYTPSESSTSQTVVPECITSSERSAAASAVQTSKGQFEASDAERIQMHIDEKPNVEIVLEEEEPIDVAIEQTATAPMNEVESPRAMAFERRDHQVDNDNNYDIAAPQVVIHSAESDSDSAGFATLNPIINRSGRGRRSSVSMQSSVTANPPILHQLPIAEGTGESSDRLTLVINALGATGLTKAEKFGTQSTYLEMRVCELDEELPSGATTASFFRTALHKKGGSEAQWNQQFTAQLRSKSRQVLHAAVRTHSKMLIGETRVSLAEIGDSFFDQHFSIHRVIPENGRENAGQIHLQLKIMETTPSIVMPQLRLSVVDLKQHHPTLPVELRNGSLMFKVPFHSHSLIGPGSARRQWVTVVDNHGIFQITWCDPIDTNDKCRGMNLSEVTEIRGGPGTKAFERYLQSDPSSVARESDRCFSLVTRSRSLDLVASSKDEAQIWIEGLRQLVFSPTQDRRELDESTRSMSDFKQTALSARGAAREPHAGTKKSQLSHWRTSIFELARLNRHDAISTCLHDGCPVDLLETGSGDTLLMLACRVGNVGLVELCLMWRAKNDPHPEFGETALQVAVNAGQSQCLALILSTAAKSDMDSEIVNHIDSKNDAPLHVAARKGDLACLQLLLHHGADICVVEEFGRTPLHCAVLSGGLDCVAYLLDVGGDSVLNAGDHDGDTALHYAAMSGNESIVKLLLESAADVHSTNVHDETPYDLAVRENHSSCIKLIGQYYHVASKEASTPALRNESASSLLKLQQSQDQEFDRETDADDVDDQMDEVDECYLEPSDSPVRRGPIELASHGYGEEQVYAAYAHHARATPAFATSRQALSPSARVREVLANHRQRVSVASVGRPNVESPQYYHSARESPYGLASTTRVPARHAYTERIDRDYYQSPHGYQDRSSYQFSPDHRRLDRSSHNGDARYESSPIASRGRSMSAMVYGSSGPDYNGGCEDYNSWQYHHGSATSRRSNSADMSYQHTRGAWHNVQAHPSELKISSPPANLTNDMWDTYYSDEGYAYYINRTTGVSQWENPYEYVAEPQSSAEAPSQHLAVSGSLNADTMIRMRLAEARQSKSGTFNQTRNDPTTTNSDGNTTYTELVPTTREVNCNVGFADVSPIPSTDESTPPSPKTRASKYEARTGLSLSVDIASPPVKDDTRPVFIPSPRSRSPRRKEGDNGGDGESSFEKSTRPSSPRGKSKNLQVIELKRANNLALALSSFKINDRNDQIVQAIATMDEKVVNAELLACLQRFFPTDDEAKVLRDYDGQVKSLGTADRFFYHLLQVPDVLQRIECFLYKLQFTRSHRSVHTKIQLMKRACRDFVENYVFTEAVSEFFSSHNSKSFSLFRNHVAQFKSDFLKHADDKLQSFQDDLRRASDIELLDVQMQFNRLVTGHRAIQSFVDKANVSDDRNIAARDILQRFLAESRGKIVDLENEYESMGQWEDKVLTLFGESKASCQLSPILECLCDVLESNS